jgi:hypothetical protein
MNTIGQINSYSPDTKNVSMNAIGKEQCDTVLQHDQVVISGSSGSDSAAVETPGFLSGRHPAIFAGRSGCSTGSGIGSNFKMSAAHGFDLRSFRNHLKSTTSLTGISVGILNGPLTGGSLGGMIGGALGISGD